MAASATFALKAGVWFRRGRLLMVSPGSRRTACPLSGRNSTYRPVQISGTGSYLIDLDINVDATGAVIPDTLLRDDSTKIGDVAIYQICGGAPSFALPPILIAHWPVFSHSRAGSHNPQYSHYRHGTHNPKLSHERARSHTRSMTHYRYMSGQQHEPKLSAHPVALSHNRELSIHRQPQSHNPRISSDLPVLSHNRKLSHLPEHSHNTRLT